MITENNILGRLDNPIKVRMDKGFYTPSDSDIGISLEMIGSIYYPLESRRWAQAIPSRKPRSKFYLEVTFTLYKANPTSREMITRAEYRLPSGELAYVADCQDTDQPCERKWLLRAFEIFKQHSGAKLNETPLKQLYERESYEDNRVIFIPKLSRDDVIQLRKKSKSTKPKRKTCSCKKK